MGYVKPENRPLSHHLQPHRTIGVMRSNGWLVRSRCLLCHVELLVDLDVMIKLNGEDLKLWDRTARCRRAGCAGRMIFLGSPPGWHLSFWPLLTPPSTSTGL